MNTKELIQPLENNKNRLLNERQLFINKIDNEINLVDLSIKDAVKELNGISDKVHTWIIGDVFTTNFFSNTEVCIIKDISNGIVSFIRLESIKDFKTLKKDFCAVQVEVELFLKMNKLFIHHSEWYIEYND